MSVAKQEEELAEAYWRLGQGLAAEQGHPDGLHAASVKARFYFAPNVSVHPIASWTKHTGATQSQAISACPVAWHTS